MMEVYWKFATERQEIFFRKLRGDGPPYTNDPILRKYKFCNAYRASDRVSQFLIRNVIYKGNYNEINTLFRVFLFRLFNRTETWKLLEEKLGEINLKNFSREKYSKILEQGVIYGNAFILCANKVFGYERKHDNHLALLEKVFLKDKVRLDKGKSLEELFKELKTLPLIGNFMAYQIAIDFNYSEVFDFDENEFTIAGPGALRGIKKCFGEIKKDPAEIIMEMVKEQEKIKFKNLFGRPLHAIDCQNLFCEVDKYLRVARPELKSERKKIKTKYKESLEKIIYFYPPKWKINNFVFSSV